MTHYLRSRHSAILIGISTLLADDPGLNCRISSATSQPRPIIIDPRLRWQPSGWDKVLQLCRKGQGLAPYVLTGVGLSDIPQESSTVLHDHGGKFIHVDSNAPGPNGCSRFDWNDILDALQRESLSSVMVEGGAQIINSLLDQKYHDLVDSVIVTIAPTWLGKGGVVVSPGRVHDEKGAPFPAARLSKVQWHPFGEDVVLCGTLRS
jgi:2,5-diamino-6-(ribosylamino)-4(3H)-pyrimidinone 5'-phosphate reductase